MPHKENPFASPQAESTGVLAEAVAGIWREGDILVVSKRVKFPDRCVKCNAPAEGYRLQRSFSWHHFWIYLTLLLGVLPYLALAFLFRQKAAYSLGLCPVHRAYRKKMILIAWLIVFVAMGLFFLALVQLSGIIVLAGCVFLVVGIVVGIVGTSTLSPKRMDKTHAWLKGAGSDFIASFPPVE